MRVLFLLLALLFTPPLAAQAVPEVLEGKVYDPQKWVQDSRKGEIEAMLEKVEELRDLRLFAVVFEKEPPMGAEAYARKLGRRHGGPGVWGVIIHIPGVQGSPWCVAERGGDLPCPNQERLDQAVKMAVTKARKENDERLRLHVACKEVAEELAFISATLQGQNEERRVLRNEFYEADRRNVEWERFQRRILMVGVPLLLLVGLMLASYFRRKFEEKRRTFFFPDTEFRYRFQAPWSGGSDVLLKYTSQIEEGGSR
ncbi:MAG: hypothetical protein ACON5H_02640 [Akkermansiaceae bacterium]